MRKFDNFLNTILSVNLLCKQMCSYTFKSEVQERYILSVDLASCKMATLLKNHDFKRTERLINLEFRPILTSWYKNKKSLMLEIFELKFHLV